MCISDGDELFSAKRKRRKKGSELFCTEKGSGENTDMNFSVQKKTAEKML